MTCSRAGARSSQSERFENPKVTLGKTNDSLVELTVCPGCAFTHKLHLVGRYASCSASVFFRQKDRSCATVGFSNNPNRYSRGKGICREDAEAFLEGELILLTVFWRNV